MFTRLQAPFSLLAYRKRKQAFLLAVFFVSIFLFFLFFPFSQTHAYQIVDTNSKLTGDFVLSPAKLELNLKPGETATRTISVINRVNRAMKFGIDIEDFEGSDNPNKPVVLLGNGTGPYSLKDFLHPEVSNFTLKPGQKITLPITISIPKDAEPGGLYGSVLVHNSPAEDGGSGAQLVERLGALFFVRVAGDADVGGQLQDFRLAGDRNFFTGGPFAFEFIYKNTGNVHLVPYGTITVYNTIGNPIKKIKIDPYFALPNAIRYRKITWNKNVLLGRYTAVLQLNRGYGADGGTVDTKSIVFWVFPWKWIVGALVALFIIIFIVYFVATKLDIRLKKR